METRCHLHNMQVKKTSIQEVEEEGEEEAQQREVTQEELYASIGAFKPPKGWDVVALTQEQHEQLHTKKFQWSNKRVNLIPQCLWLGGIAMGGLGAVWQSCLIEFCIRLPMFLTMAGTMVPTDQRSTRRWMG
jgi:hypothetical protein